MYECSSYGVQRVYKQDDTLPLLDHLNSLRESKVVLSARLVSSQMFFSLCFHTLLLFVLCFFELLLSLLIFFRRVAAEVETIAWLEYKSA